MSAVMSEVDQFLSAGISGGTGTASGAMGDGAGMRDGAGRGAGEIGEGSGQPGTGSDSAPSNVEDWDQETNGGATKAGGAREESHNGAGQGSRDASQQDDPGTASASQRTDLGNADQNLAIRGPQGREAGSRSDDDVRGSYYDAAARILGTPAEELAKLKPADLAVQMAPKLEEFENLRSAYEVAKPIVDLLSKPANLIDAHELAETLATERPVVYDKLAEEMVLSHAPEYLVDVVGRFQDYNPQEQAAIDNAVETHLERRIQQMTGTTLTGDQIGAIVRAYMTGQLRADSGAQNGYESGGGYSRGRAGSGQAGQLTAEVADLFGLDVASAEHQRLWSWIQERESGLARQLGGQVQSLQGKLSQLEEGQTATSQQLAERQTQESGARLEKQLEAARAEMLGKLKVPKGYEDELEVVKNALESRINASPELQSLKEQIKGWYLEGNEGRAANLIGRYANRVGQLLGQIAGPRMRRIAEYEGMRSKQAAGQSRRREFSSGGPAQARGNGGKWRNEEQMLDGVVAQAMERLRAKTGR